MSLCPSKNWNGEGLLGAEIGFGYLHRLPESSRNSTGTSIGFVSVAANEQDKIDNNAGMYW